MKKNIARSVINCSYETNDKCHIISKLAIVPDLLAHYKYSCDHLTIFVPKIGLHPVCDQYRFWTFFYQMK